MTPQIVMYGRAQGCDGCDDAKSLLKEYDLPYDFRDIGTDDSVKRIEYKKELREYRVDKIPFLIINGKKIIGFDKNAIDSALGRC